MKISVTAPLRPLTVRASCSAVAGSSALVYDVTANVGWVSVGIDHDTAEFAVQSIRHWWLEMGRPMYAQAKRLLITADCGGTHLQPPCAITKARADRFSPYFKRPELYGIQVTPGEAYEHIFPFGKSQVERLAYHYDISSPAIDCAPTYTREATDLIQAW
jgi:hypothetical protein